MSGGYFYTMNNSGTINANAEIPLTTTGTTYGDTDAPAPTLAGDGGITLAAGTYVVDYSQSSDAQGGDEIVSAFLTLDGTEIPGSRITSTQPGGLNGFFNNVSGAITITVPAGGAELELHNGNNNIGYNVTGNDGTAVTGDLNIERVQ